MDLNHNAILRRLDYVIARNGEASERNEFDFFADVQQIIIQLEIYDRIHYVRNIPESGEHIVEGIALANDIIARSEEIPNGGNDLNFFQWDYTEIIYNLKKWLLCDESEEKINV